MIDVMVTIAVIMTLLAISMPGYTKVREHANRLVCRSNIRQIGYGLAMYADQNRDRLPYTMFVTPGGGLKSAPQETTALRLSKQETPPGTPPWDGVGILFDQGILPTLKVFFCPSYTGPDQFEEIALKYDDQPGRVYGNYQFRGIGPNGETRLSQIEPIRSALVCDSLRSKVDYCHRVGANVLRADLSVFWFADNTGTVSKVLAEDNSAGALVIKPAVESAWMQLDKAASGSN